MRAGLLVASLLLGAGCVFDPAGVPSQEDLPGDEEADAAVDSNDPADASIPTPTPTPDATPCPPGWTAGAASCYLVVTSARPWDDARAACLQADAHLVVIDDDAENQEVRALADATFPRWIGLTDVAREGTWVWVDGRTAAFQAWALLQPDDFLFSEDCAQQAEDGAWNDRACAVAAAFVCERDAVSF